MGMIVGHGGLVLVMTPTLEQFLKHIADSGLLSREELRAFTDGLPPERRPKNAESLARELVAKGKLTTYQATLVWQGNRAQRGVHRQRADGGGTILVATTQKKQSRSVRVGKNLKFRLAELETIAAQHDADHKRGLDMERPTLGKLNDLIQRFPSSSAVPPHIAIPLSKKEYARLVRLAERSGVAVESLLVRWVRNQLARST